MTKGAFWAGGGNPLERTAKLATKFPTLGGAMATSKAIRYLGRFEPEEVVQVP